MLVEHIFKVLMNFDYILIFKLGFGVKQDTNEAIKWWELCSQSKSLTAVRAMNTLALLYSSAENFDEEKVY